MIKKYKFKFTTMQRQWLARCIRRALGNLIVSGKTLKARSLASATYGIEWDEETVLSESNIDDILGGADEFGCDVMSVTCSEDPEGYDPMFVKLMQQDDMEKISKEVWDILSDPEKYGEVVNK